MDIVRFKGGLGNQMFQYALMEALRHRGREVHASLGYYENGGMGRKFILGDVFPNTELMEIEEGIFQEINQKWRNIKENPECLEVFKKNLKDRFFYVEDQNSVFDEKVFQTLNCTFVGYWQTEKYFQDIKGELQRKYFFRISDDKLQKLADKLQNNYFSIHIRQGDYFYDYYKAFYGGICTEQYYHKAMKYIKVRVPDAKFIIFSDEMERLNMKIARMQNSIVFDESEFENYQDWYDMYLMSNCKGNIIANSSFGWWGAWLNQNPDKIVIAPKVWLNGQETPDIWCDGWIRM